MRHGIESATYSSDGEEFLPMLCCLCGFYSHAPSWEEAGLEFDEHLAAEKTTTDTEEKR